MFPEGTSGDGTRVLAFKSALFDAARAAPGTWVQPVTVAYRRDVAGRPLAGALRDRYAWYGDAELLPHLWAMFGLIGAHVEVILHAPLKAADFARRKALARACEEAVRGGLERGVVAPRPSVQLAPDLLA